MVFEANELEAAIAAIEAQRTTLGDEAAETAVAALRKKLIVLQSTMPRHEQATVLVADLSGFTAISEMMDAEEVGATLNALWQRLDRVVEAWGGVVDKHTGDGLIALFGVHALYQNGPERAVQAALDMHIELAVFNERALEKMKQSEVWFRLRLRIGVHNGPILLTKLGQSDKSTAVGDTVTIATALEEEAPLDGVLVSEDIYRHVRQRFDLQGATAVAIEGKRHPIPAYTVQGEKQQTQLMIGADSSQGRLVGHNEALTRLQFALEETVDARVAQVVTVIGEVGVGKSHLLEAFVDWLALMPTEVRLFTGRVYQEAGQLPYALIQDMFASYFDTHRRSSLAIAGEKLVRGLAHILPVNRLEAREQAHYIGQLIGFDFLNSHYLEGATAQQIRTRAFEYTAQFFTAVTEMADVAILFFDNIHWADEGALDLIEYWVQSCRDVPLFIVCLGQPSFFTKRSSWEVRSKMAGGQYQRIDLEPLNFIDSSHLLTELLPELPRIPTELSDFVLSTAQGNPLYMTLLLKILRQKGIIDQQEGGWQVKIGQLRTMGPPPSFMGLFEMMFEALLPEAQSILQKAAVFGPVFWDTSIVQLGETRPFSSSLDAVQIILQQLEGQGLVYWHRAITSVQAREYVFAYEDLVTVAYDAIPSLKRSHYHATAAQWYSSHFGEDDVRYADVIAMHFEQAGDVGRAADWYGRAGEQAQARYAPTTAIKQYRRALSLLPDGLGTARQRLGLYHGLAEMLRWQAKFEESTQMFAAMWRAANVLSDTEGEMCALHGIFLAQDFQRNHSAALKSAQRLEKTARKVDDTRFLARALAGQAWSRLFMNEAQLGLGLAREALSLSSTVSAQWEMAYSNLVIGAAFRSLRQLDRAVRFIERARVLFREVNERMWEGLTLTHLAHVYRIQEDHEQAKAFYRQGLRLARDIGHDYGTLLCLNHLGQLAQEGGATQELTIYRQERAVLIEKIGRQPKSIQLG